MTINEELEQLLKNLKLRRILDVVDEQVRAAGKEHVSYTEFLTRLMRAQWHARQEHALEWRIRTARLPERGSLDTFPFQRQPGVNRKQIRGFAELDFITKKENIVLIGPTGVGKSGLASGILLKAIENGYRCQFIRAQDLFDEMYASLADRSTRQLLNRLAKLDLLLIDELGYLNLKPEQSNIFFKLMEERYRRKPSIITTNLDYDEWHNFLGNRPMVEALLSLAAPLLPHRPHQWTLASRPSRLMRMTKNEYIAKVLGAYRRMPGAAGAARPNDRRLAGELYDRGVAITDVEHAIILAAARRIFRPKNAPPLQPVRSLYYLLPVLDEVLAAHVSHDYYRYLQFKIDQARSENKRP